MLRHHEWGETVLSTRLEDWERRFFNAVALDSLERRDQTITSLQQELSQLRGFLGALHLANETMRRRARNQPGFPGIVRQEADDRCNELQALLAAQRSALRESFGLLAGATADQQARAAQATERRIQKLTILGTLATGLVLVPGLIAAIYGAQVKGLPGQDKVDGLKILLISSGVAAIVTMLVFLVSVGARRRSSRSS
jgi:Mg2+ and Co2+ transporter CorA